ncbi:hypothetical protein RhiirA1_476677 [Rhizophagus irregularis]|uniref:Uncharacterized protein n=1 Tax=Rhizophagus irregularis TaxID=588596 RepID=A0A2N0QUU3_9GLOM|nr:hypothetical protein RhiirA1_476677 [Rhizophagus irregularis]
MSFAVKFALLRRVPRYDLFILRSIRGILMFSRRSEEKPLKRSIKTFRKRFLYPFCRIKVFRILGLSVFDFRSGIRFLMLLIKRGNEMMVFSIRLQEVFSIRLQENTGRLDDGIRNEPVSDVRIKALFRLRVGYIDFGFRFMGFGCTEFGFQFLGLDIWNSALGSWALDVQNSALGSWALDVRNSAFGSWVWIYGIQLSVLGFGYMEFGFQFLGFG